MIDWNEAVINKLILGVNIVNNTSAKVGRAKNITYSHTNIKIRKLIGEGYIEWCGKNGSRSKKIRLTEKGIKTKSLLEDLNAVSKM